MQSNSFVTDESLSTLMGALDVTWEALTAEGTASIHAPDGGAFEVHVEGVKCAEAESKKEAVLLQSIALYVFGQNAPTKTKNINMFLERMVFGVELGSYIPARVRAVMGELKQQ